MTKEIDRIIGSRISSIRKDRGFSQEKLAELAGFKSKSSIALIEAGERGVTQMGLIRLSKALNVPITAIISDTWDDDTKRLSMYLQNAEEWQIKAIYAILGIKSVKPVTGFNLGSSGGSNLGSEID